MEESLTTAIQTHRSPDHTSNHLTRQNFSNALDILAEAPTSSLAAPTAMTASSFDREFSILALDIAPYVRSIAAHDLQIEQQRLKISNLLSAGGGTKKMRMTRASRSAIEGGRRETTRRERWFGKELNLGLVLGTGGKGWGKISKINSVDEEGSVGSGIEGSGRDTREASVRSLIEGDAVMGVFRAEDESSVKSVADDNTMDELA
jgi:hypothetical protein